MRKLLIVLMTSLAAMGVHAWEPTTADVQPENMTAQDSYADVLVTIGAVRTSPIAAGLVAAGLAYAGALGAATHLVQGRDRATMLVPAGVQIDSYANAGYRMVVEDAVAEVEVDLAPL